MRHFLHRLSNRANAASIFVLFITYGADTASATLPVTFEENRGQVASEALFLANASGYRVFLTRQGAVIVSQSNQVARIRLERSGNPRPVGTHSLIAKTNYLGGSDPSRRIRGIPNYGEVTYPEVYPGIDMIWHANEGQIEHDFVVAGGADPRRIRLSFPGAALRLSPEGDLLAGMLRLRKPRAYQGEREVTCRYALHDDSISFVLGGYDRALPITIDPVLSFSTYLGAAAFPAAIALDGAGNVYVAGRTTSPNFPVTANAFQHGFGAGQCPAPEPFGGTSYQACDSIFVAKFTGDGKTLLYSTYLGGGGPFNTEPTAIAVGLTGNAYVLGNGSSRPLTLTPLPSQTATGSFVIALSADGSSLLFGTALPVGATAIAVDAAGAIYLAGSTRSRLPVVNAFQATPGDSNLFKTSDAGTHWQAVKTVPLVSFATVAVDPSNPQVLYIGGVGALYRTSDGGAHWSSIATPLDPRGVPLGVVIDPHSPQTLYLTASGSAPYKSVDGGATWTLCGPPGAPPTTALIVDPTNSSTLYAITSSSLYKSTDGAATWNLTGLAGQPGQLVIDPSNGTLYATSASPTGLLKSTDGGATWTSLNDGRGFSVLAIDPSNSQTLYASSNGNIAKSVDGGAHWTLSKGTAGFAVISLLVDPASPSHVWAATSGGMWVTLDSGNTWNRTLATYGSGVVSLVTDNAGTIYAVGSGAPGDAFAMKLDPTGSNILYSTYLGGIGTDSASAIAVDSAGRAYIAGATGSPDFPLATPLQSSFEGGTDAFLTVLDPTGSHLAWSTYLSASSVPQASWIAVDSAGNVHVAGKTSVAKIKGDGSAVIFAANLGAGTTASSVAADAAGNTYVAGTTTSANLPAVNALQPTLAGRSDAFVAEFNGQTGAVQYATYLGGSQDDSAASLAVDAAGNAYVTGFTISADFPLNNSWQGSFSNVFVAKLAAQPVTLNGLTNAASYTPTVAPGELISIFGAGLAAAPASATQLPLPAQLSGAQVTVNGVAAPLLYASPQQLNLQIPFETQSGIANVQVSSSEGTSTMTVQVAATAPAIFALNQQGTGPGAILHGTTYQVVTDSNPAAAGQIISIFCTGLGAVNPPAQTGAVPPDPPSQAVAAVQVSIAGVTVQPLYAGVAPGYPGLYQINAQLPPGTPPGAQPLTVIQNGSTSNTVTLAVR